MNPQAGWGQIIMSGIADLRWILLLVGLLFLVALAAWESRRSRRLRSEEAAARDAGGFASAARESREAAGGSVRRESLAHAPGSEPLIHELSLDALGAQAGPPAHALDASATAPEAPEGGQHTRATYEEVALQDGALPMRGRHAEPTLGQLPEEPAELSSPMPLEDAGEGQAVLEEPQPQEAGAPGDAWPESQAPGSALSAGPADAEPASAAPALDPDSSPGGAEPLAIAAGAAAPRVEWPAEGERQIISVRVVGLRQERLSGRAMRLALAACGFVLGRYRIFHQAAADGRALLSCASLSKPGNFDPVSMDFQRYAGLSLFTVLPGPLPAAQALERLLETGRDLTQRLEAQLQDERGLPLDSARIAALRASVREGERESSEPPRGGGALRQGGAASSAQPAA